MLGARDDYLVNTSATGNKFTVRTTCGRIALSMESQDGTLCTVSPVTKYEEGEEILSAGYKSNPYAHDSHALQLSRLRLLMTVVCLSRILLTKFFIEIVESF